jgi:soluble lytic murein transglycosylase-like protein
LIEVESAYHTRAVSPKCARGLMQVMPQRQAVRPLDLVRPGKSISTRAFSTSKKLLTRYDLPLALAAYNAGEAAVIASAACRRSERRRITSPHPSPPQSELTAQAGRHVVSGLKRVRCRNGRLPAFIVSVRV